jgi:hypothetical protein
MVLLLPYQPPSFEILSCGLIETIDSQFHSFTVSQPRGGADFDLNFYLRVTEDNVDIGTIPQM